MGFGGNIKRNGYEIKTRINNYYNFTKFILYLWNKIASAEEVISSFFEDVKKEILIHF